MPWFHSRESPEIWRIIDLYLWCTQQTHHVTFKVKNMQEKKKQPPLLYNYMLARHQSKGSENWRGAVSKSICIRSKTETEDLNRVKGQLVHASLSQPPNTWCNDRPIFLFSLEDTQLSSAKPAKAVKFWINWHDLLWFTVRGTTVGVHLDLKMQNTDVCAKKRQCLQFNPDMLRLWAQILRRFPRPDKPH